MVRLQRRGGGRRRAYAFPASHAFRDEVVAGSQEDAGDARGPESFEERLVVRHDDRADRHVDVPENASQLCIQVDLELEGHQEGVRIEEDESGQRFRTIRSAYLTMR